MIETTKSFSKDSLTAHNKIFPKMSEKNSKIFHKYAYFPPTSLNSSLQNLQTERKKDKK